MTGPLDLNEFWSYSLVLAFFAFYPVVSSFVWVATALLYYWKWERHPNPQFYKLDPFPLVSILVPTFDEEETIANSLQGLLEIDYPFKEIVVVDDASTDRTLEEIHPFVASGQVRLVRKRVNEGKAMALNDAIPALNGEIVLIVDADAYCDPRILKWLVPHFDSPRVAAVTGNPRVANRDTFLAELQLIEFASIVGLLRRAQRIWGRILTMSGVVGAFRKSALIDVGLFSPEMATEDIDMTWKLQTARYDVRYEPRAVVWMEVPTHLSGLWHQRFRWAKGLAQVLRRHGKVLGNVKNRRLWPVLIEAVLSISWAYCGVFLLGSWILSRVVGVEPLGVSPFPNWWGMLIGTACILQLAVGVSLEKRYDPSLPAFFLVAVFYPLVYWMLMAILTVVATPAGLWGPLKQGRMTRWKTPRQVKASD